MTTGTVSQPGSTVRESREIPLPDLGAVIHTDGVPRDLAAEIPGLHGCLFTTLEYQTAVKHEHPTGVCVLEDPRHVLLFTRRGAEVDVHNRACVCGPGEIDRIHRALFRAFPDVRRVRLDVVFPPGELPAAWSPVDELTYMMIDLPSSVDEYHQSLGKSTRKTIRGYGNRLRRDHPDVRMETVSPAGRGREFVDKLVEWKIRRFRECGRTTYWEADPDMAEGAAALLELVGQCRVTYIGGAEAAIHLCLRSGDTVAGYEGAYDPAYQSYRLGFLTMYDAVCAAIESGAARFNAMAGVSASKELLGAKPVVARRVTIHRSALRRSLYLLGGKASRRPAGRAALRVAHWLRRDGRASS
ncbi:MAG: GNAT family N-acetyltransferase [Actinobacteria bacterium]|nr:GNAT family N-acetyltransferase [Actinomycetota bacterium]